jgi:5-methylcytosine-specific restriction endonuclease McrA
MKILLVFFSALILVGCSGSAGKYIRDDWGEWTQKSGCSTREIVLKRDGSNVVVDKNCAIVSGRWLSQYDQQYITDPHALQIDHVVPLKEAHDSGAADWPKPKKNRFYNNLRNLVAVSSESNQKKSSSDPAKWLPNEKYQCAYILRYAEIKEEFSLTMDNKEKTVVQNIQNSCIK